MFARMNNYETPILLFYKNEKCYKNIKHIKNHDFANNEKHMKHDVL